MLLDIFCVALLIVSAGLGWRKGALSQIVGIGILVASVVAARVVAPSVVSALVKTPVFQVFVTPIGILIGFLIFYLVIRLVIGIATPALSEYAASSDIDAAAGAVIGVVKAGLLLAAVIIPLTALSPVMARHAGFLWVDTYQSHVGAFVRQHNPLIAPANRFPYSATFNIILSVPKEDKLFDSAARDDFYQRITSHPKADFLKDRYVLKAAAAANWSVVVRDGRYADLIGESTEIRRNFDAIGSLLPYVESDY